MSNNKIDRRFAAFVYNNKPLLVMPVDGYFASIKFLEGGSRHEVSGSKFGFIAGDDRFRYCENKNVIAEVTTEEVEELLEDPRLDKEFVEFAKNLKNPPKESNSEWGLTLSDLKERWCV